MVRLSAPGLLEDHPAFRRLNVDHRRPRVVNEALGFLVRCILSELADGRAPVITCATADKIGGSRARILLELATRCGLIVANHALEDGQDGWVLAPDGPLKICQHTDRGWTLCLG